MFTETTEQEERWTGIFEQLAQHRRVQDHSGQLVGIRQDVSCAMTFMVLDLNGDTLIGQAQMEVAERHMRPNTPDVYDAISLFWNMYQPWMFNAQLQGLDPTADWHRDLHLPAPASAELAELLRTCLDWIHCKFRTPYEPDADSSRNPLDLITEFHIAAARAFKLRQLEADWYSEELQTSLRAAEGLANRIRAIMRLHPTGGQNTTSFAISTNAVGAMVQLELSRVCRANGSYAEAIHHLDQASTSYIWALDGIEDTYGDDGESAENGERLARLDLKRRLIPMEVSTGEAAALFNLLRESPPTDTNWRQVAEDCRGLAILPDLEWKVFSCVEGSEYVKDEETCFDLTWSEFWYAAAAWASVRLSPDEYRRMREDDERDAAESRLSTYFFIGTWDFLPQRTQERLISADVIWNSRQRVSRETILNDLLRAVEEMCYSYIVRPYTDAREGTALGVRDYIRMCELPKYRDFAARHQLEESDIRFLTEDLPTALRQLADARNPADHEAGSSATMEEVTSAYRLFLGIGRPGILPEFARIGRKLQKAVPENP